MKNYTTKEAAEIIGVSIRTIQRQVATVINELSHINNKGASINEGVLNLIKWRCNDDTMTTSGDIEKEEEFDYIEGFTTSEYIEFQKRINEYPVLREYIENLKEQIEFLRFNSSQQVEVIRDLSVGIKQRNYIEAKEKGFDNQEAEDI